MTALLDRRAFLELGSRVVGAASALSFVSCTPRPRDGAIPELPAAIPQFLDVRVPELLAASKVPGASMAIVKDAALAWTGSYGRADADTGALVSDTTIFEAGSVSKTVFAYAALKLCDRGVLTLDAPLTTYFDERLLDDPRLDQVTVRRVLSHSIGWPNWRSASEPFKFAFTPGERWSYSGEGYWYLQSVITHLLGRVDPANCSTFELDLRVCGTDIGDYLKKNVLDPLGMTRSGYLWRDEFETQMARGHDEQGRVRNPRRKANTIETARYAAAGGLHTTASEYTNFLIEVLDPKPEDTYHLSRTMRDEMIRPQITVDPASSWALGWQIIHKPSGDLLLHTGDNPGFKAFVLASPVRKSGWVILVNGDNASPIFNALIDETCPLNQLF